MLDRLFRWADRTFYSSLRGKLILGLVPGFIVLLLVAGVGWYAVNVMEEANAQLAETGWELSTTRALQLNFQQALIPFNNHLISPDSQVNNQVFVKLADNLDKMFAEASNAYEEAEEQVFLEQARSHWQTVRSQAKRTIDTTDAMTQAEAEASLSELQGHAQIVWQNLEDLHDFVFQEMQTSVKASHASRDIAIGLLLLSAFAALVMGILFVLIFSNYITRPIRTLEAGAAQLGRGDLDFKLDLNNRDELGALAAEFNRMAARLKDVYTHLEDRVQERTAQLKALDEASRVVASELKLEQVLQAIADLARSLGGARFAAVLVPRAEEAAPPRFIVSQDPALPFDAPEQRPQGRGLLGHLLQSDSPIRLDDMTQHPAAVGLPDGHPPMQSFLGIPIQAHGKTIGGLYVADRIDGQTFDDEDEQVLTMLAAHAAVAIENARLYEEVTQMNEQLEARVQQRTAQLEAVSAERALYATRLRQVLNRTVRIQEAERQRIAKGVHDGVSQWLMGALFELQAARVRLPEEFVDVEKHLSEAQRVLKDVKQEMRRVIYDLHPPLLESNGLVTALRGHITEMQAHFPFACRLEVMGEPIRLSPQQELAMYRIAQEALTNVVKHAGTDQATVGLSFESDVVRLWIVDEGRGFEQNNGRVTNKPSLGLLSMRERAMAVGGTFSMRTAPGQGTRIEVSVPVKSTEGSRTDPMVAIQGETS